VKILTFILALLFLATPMQAHVDIIAFDSIESHVEEDNFSKLHQQNHHSHDSEDEKKSDHHHHCVDLSVSFAYIQPLVSFDFICVPNSNEIIDFYTKKHSSKDLESLFQPPRVA